MSSVKIGDVEYQVLPGHGTIVMFCERNNLEYWEFVDLFTNIDPQKLSLKFVKGLADFTLCMIERANKDVVLPDVYEIADWLGDMDNMLTVQKLIFGAYSKKVETTGENQENSE